MVDNPRFPHYVKIFRAKTDTNGTPVIDPATGEELFESVFGSQCGMRDMVRGWDIDVEVVKADYKLALPKHNIIIKKGDYLEFTNSITGEVKKGRVEESKIFNLGANIWFNENGNG
ncbi:hypothetical protein CLV62_104128 [Dysgonomonas alginatilytica]|uniref:Uncharacterized protein n=1 Tax=Dysgonomonas alginatilytica TaxID=1605892 RepID=A0A2V3PR58_9BACT|nr:hypothetical protein [Dysgonomonas alginatilytica]PXV66867.1 hypothetical protein CLV62_104128 [Dysgonomonas alginatilytica]